MASHGTRVFVLGGESSAGPQADETMPIHILDTRTCFCCYLIWTVAKVENSEHIKFHFVPEESRAGLWNVCGLWKRRRGETRNA